MAPGEVNSPQSIVQEIDYILNCIDCALAHPRPLPQGRHAYQSGLADRLPPEVSDLYHCLYKLYTEESCSTNFREPVNAVELGVWKYYDTINIPMSLRTVLDRIASGGHYSTTEQVMSDVELIWANCGTFNGSTSPITAEAEKCRKALTRLVEALEEDKLAPEEDVDAIVAEIQGHKDPAIYNALNDYFRRKEPSMMIGDEVDVSALKLRHLRAIREILQGQTPQ